jgi:U2 small nuclear ribonucleoprotein A'
MLGRLTPELILRSPQYMNPVNQYEIDLRANRVAAIENLGATEVRAPLQGRGAAATAVALGAASAAARAVAQACPFPLLLLLQNQFDSIDLSDNSIVRLEGFPKLPRLQCLHLSNNRINRIARNLEGERAACSRQAVGLAGTIQAAGCSRDSRGPGPQLHSHTEA